MSSDGTRKGRGASARDRDLEAESNANCQHILHRATEVAVFALAVKELWMHVPWGLIEAQAAREWNAIRWPTGARSWREVRSFVREVWEDEEW